MKLSQAAASRFNRPMPYRLHRRVWPLLLLPLQGCAGPSESAHGPALDGAVWLRCGMPSGTL